MFLGLKGGRGVRLTGSPHRHLWADCHKNVGASTACYRDSFTFSYVVNLVDFNCSNWISYSPSKFPQGDCTYTASLMYAERKKLKGIMSGERGGQVVGDLRILSLPYGSVESLRLVRTTLGHSAGTFELMNNITVKLYIWYVHSLYLGQCFICFACYVTARRLIQQFRRRG
jgi:hypothetical protein